MEFSAGPATNSRFKLDLHPVGIAVIGIFVPSLPFLGALALASVDFGEERISGDVTLTTFLGGVRNGDAQNLHTGLRLSVSEYFWLEKSGYAIQVQGTV